MPTAPIVTADSITRIAEEARGAVVVNASHGGVYAAYLAAKLGAAAAIFNDAGAGRESAGIGGLDYLQQLGIPSTTAPTCWRAASSAMPIRWPRRWVFARGWRAGMPRRH